MSTTPITESYTHNETAEEMRPDEGTEETPEKQPSELKAGYLPGGKKKSE